MSEVTIFEFCSTAFVLASDYEVLRAELAREKRQEPVAYLRNEVVPNNLVLCAFTCRGAFGVYRRPTPEALSLPERRQSKHYWKRLGKLTASARIAAQEWNACLDAVEELNK